MTEKQHHRGPSLVQLKKQWSLNAVAGIILSRYVLSYRRQAPLLLHFSTSYLVAILCKLCITFSPVFPVFGCKMYPGIQHTAKTKGTKGLRVLCIVLSCRTELYCELHIAHSYNLHAVSCTYVCMH